MKNKFFLYFKYCLNFPRRIFIQLKYRPYYQIQELFKDFSMTPKNRYVKNLTLVNHFRNVKGCVVECGTWRGGMIAGIAKVLGQKRHYYLFDSFEGLPDPTERDGKQAHDWEQFSEDSDFRDNLRVEMGYSERAMALSDAKLVKITKGWFSETLPLFDPNEKIAVLRLDGDFYDSTMQCLENLYKQVESGGIIIIDDYYVWDGCAKAVHDFLSKNDLQEKISQWENDICYLIKK